MAGSCLICSYRAGTSCRAGSSDNVGSRYRVGSDRIGSYIVFSYMAGCCMVSVSEWSVLGVEQALDHARLNCRYCQCCFIGADCAKAAGLLPIHKIHADTAMTDRSDNKNLKCSH